MDENKDSIPVKAEIVPSETPKPQDAPLSKKAVIAAFAVAIASDIIAIPLGIFIPPGEIALDVATAVALACIFQGVDLILVLAFVLELPPGIDFLPWWTAIVYARWKGIKLEGIFKFIANAFARK